MKETTTKSGLRLQFGEQANPKLYVWNYDTSDWEVLISNPRLAEEVFRFTLANGELGPVWV